jgi:hypothetical protein
MGGHGGKYKRRKYLNAILALARAHPDKFTLENCTRETYKIKAPALKRSYSVAANHSGISEYIAKGVGEILENLGVCTKDEFIKRIK